jgi:hypothetical protein
MNATDTSHTQHLQIENLDYESYNHQGPFRVGSARLAVAYIRER